MDRVSVFRWSKYGVCHHARLNSGTGKRWARRSCGGHRESFMFVSRCPTSIPSTSPPHPADKNVSTVFQTIGGAFSTSAGQSAFVNVLLKTLHHSAPSVSPHLVLLTGASNLHNTFPADVLPGILIAYMQGLKAVFAVAVAFCGTAAVCVWAVPWGRLPSHAMEAAMGLE